jgi:hypothetical protein
MILRAPPQLEATPRRAESDRAQNPTMLVLRSRSCFAILHETLSGLKARVPTARAGDLPPPVDYTPHQVRGSSARRKSHTPIVEKDGCARGCFAAETHSEQDLHMRENEFPREARYHTPATVKHELMGCRGASLLPFKWPTKGATLRAYALGKGRGCHSSTRSATGE